jgi:hypothetical protein
LARIGQGLRFFNPHQSTTKPTASKSSVAGSGTWPTGAPPTAGAAHVESVATGNAIRHALAMVDLINTNMASPSAGSAADRLYATTVPSATDFTNYNDLDSKLKYAARKYVRIVDTESGLGCRLQLAMESITATYRQS